MNQIVTTQGHAPAIQISNFDQLMRFGQMAAKSGMVPSQYNGKPDAIIIAVQMGSELGLAPMQALQNIAVINGRPSVWGDALLGLVRASSVCDDVIETFEGDGDSLTAICVAKRKGKSPVEARFSVEDAKNASLWSKQGPWKQYPRRMLQMRARGFALRDAFPDVLRGLITAEEAADTPQDNFRQSVSQQSIDITPEPKRVPPPVDHKQIIEAKLGKAETPQDAMKVRGQWIDAVAKSEAAGRPIAEDVQNMVASMIEERLDELAAAYQPEHADLELEHAPA
ncbi:recombinase RecT [Asaia bogorensis]|uniref:recombinase RecT n=1 Tax=Asaia bogorensis TaxID=91915 RepID=UPI003015F1F5